MRERAGHDADVTGRTVVMNHHHRSLPRRPSTELDLVGFELHDGVLPLSQGALICGSRQDPAAALPATMGRQETCFEA